MTDTVKGPSGGYRGVAMVSAETPSENRVRPNLLMSRCVGDKIATSYT